MFAAIFGWIFFCLAAYVGDKAWREWQDALAVSTPKPIWFHVSKILCLVFMFIVGMSSLILFGVATYGMF